MRLPTALTLLGLTASLTTATSTALFKNYCPEPFWLSLNNKPSSELPSGAASVFSIVGKGNTALLTKNNDTFSPETAKLVLGTSSDAGVLYWSVSSQNGDPFGLVGEHFNVTSAGLDATDVEVPNLCQNATSYDGLVHSCQDSGKVVLAVLGCPFNAA